MRRTLLIALAAALACGSLPTSAEAQLRFRGVEFWGGQYAWSGDDTESFDAGFRGGFGIWGELTRGLGVGVEGVTGGFDSPGGGELAQSRWNDAEANLVVRQAFGDRTGVHPFLEGRFGWTRISTTVPADGDTPLLVVEEDGLSYGAELGVEISLNRRARVVVAGGATLREYGSVSEEFNAIGLAASDFSATRWGLRVGISLGRTID